MVPSSEMEAKMSNGQPMIKYVPDDGELKPVFIAGPIAKARQIVVENQPDFPISDSLGYIVTIIRVEGQSRNPREVIVRIVRPTLVGEGTELLGGTDFFLGRKTEEDIMIDCALGRHMWFRGAAGTGKSTLAALLPKLFNVPSVTVDCPGIFVPKDLVYTPTAKDGTLSFELSAFAHFLDEARNLPPSTPRGFVILEELNRTPHRDSLHTLLDWRGEFSFTTPEGTYTLKVPSGVIFVATTNPVGMGYTTDELDTAMDDRFQPYDFDYPDKTWEMGFLIRHTERVRGKAITESEAEEIVRNATLLRELHKSGAVGKAPSLRRTMDAALDVTFGKSVGDAIESRIISHFHHEEGQTETDRTRAMSCLKSRGK